jgi:ketosteroid isomerase-like protein
LIERNRADPSRRLHVIRFELNAIRCAVYRRSTRPLDAPVSIDQGGQMKRFALVVGLIVAQSGLGRAALAQANPEQALIQLERDWCTAFLTRDTSILDRILASDYTGVGSRGSAETKSEALASLKDMASGFNECVDTNFKVRIYGDAAIVTALATRSGTYKGTAFKDRQSLYTDVFVRRDGRWQCVASHGTLVAAQQK